MLKKTIIAVSVLLVAVFGFYLKDKQHLDAFPHILPSYYAKEYCSCRYVMKRNAAFCENHTRQYLPISNFSEDSEKKLIKVKALGVWSSAQWIGQRQGCQIK